jgi:hypothetical protein
MLSLDKCNNGDLILEQFRICEAKQRRSSR